MFDSVGAWGLQGESTASSGCTEGRGTQCALRACHSCAANTLVVSWLGKKGCVSVCCEAECRKAEAHMREGSPGESRLHSGVAR